MSNVSAASYRGAAMAPESIVALFGQDWRRRRASPTARRCRRPSMGRPSESSIRWASGGWRPLFVSPGQVNYQIPQGTSSGPASVSLNLNGAFAGFGDLVVAAVAPGLFTADASGAGYPAAVVYRYRGKRSGRRRVGRAARRGDQQTRRQTARSGPTRIRCFWCCSGRACNRSSLSGVSATIGGMDAQVLFAGAQDSLVGVDQINLRIPARSWTQGDVNVVLGVDGTTANLVKINLKTAGTTAGLSWSMRKLPDTGQTGHYGDRLRRGFGLHDQRAVHTNNGDGTLTDRVTGLQWQQADGGEMGWDAARNACDALVLGGKDDWRLPNVHELFSLLNHNALNPAMDAAFTKTAAEYWWSSDLRGRHDARLGHQCRRRRGAASETETISGGGTKKFHVRCVRDAGAAISIRDGLQGQRQRRRDRQSHEPGLAAGGRRRQELGRGPSPTAKPFARRRGRLAAAQHQGTRFDQRRVARAAFAQRDGVSQRARRRSTGPPPRSSIKPFAPGRWISPSASRATTRRRTSFASAAFAAETGRAYAHAVSGNRSARRVHDDELRASGRPRPGRNAHVDQRRRRRSGSSSLLTTRGEQVFLERRSGRIAIPIRDLSAADRRYVEGANGARSAAQ